VGGRGGCSGGGGSSIAMNDYMCPWGIPNREPLKRWFRVQKVRDAMEAQPPQNLPMSESPAPESDANDPNQSHLLHVLQCSVLPDAVDLGRQKDSTRPPMAPDQLRLFAQKLPANTHVTSLNLSYQNMDPDALLELFAPLALLTSLRELYLAGAYTFAYGHMSL
jgi:hypothetical protein